MVHEVYGHYRQGLVDEREQILEYLGEDFLALEELRTYFPARYQEAMLTTNKTAELQNPLPLPPPFVKVLVKVKGYMQITTCSYEFLMAEEVRFELTEV
ncbi:MAG: hypothetical protein PHD54_13775 [Desulfuromonadaceae bacterium]|nr:hypothetical protein [Desulfuromonadaceae bacterium]